MESTVALKPRTYVTSSPKQGYQWLHKKDVCPPYFLKKVRNLNVDGKEGKRVNYINHRNVICIDMGLLLM